MRNVSVSLAVAPTGNGMSLVKIAAVMSKMPSFAVYRCAPGSNALFLRRWTFDSVELHELA
jgi:hypothetical protein